MKKLLVIFLALTLLLCCGCGKEEAAPIPEATPVPTPEPTPSVVEMDCALADVLSADQQDFLSTLKSDPPDAVIISVDDVHTDTVVLDLDAVRSVCTALGDARIDSEIFETPVGSPCSVTLVREGGSSIDLSFAGNTVEGFSGTYTVAGFDGIKDVLNAACENVEAQAEKNRTYLEDPDSQAVSFADPGKSWMVRCDYTPVEPIGEPDGPWQNTRTTIALTNTGEHIVMSAKLQVKYLNSDGYVVANVPKDLNFNYAPVLLGERRESIIDQVVYNPQTEDGSLDIAGIQIIIVNVNAPNEAGH